MAPCRIHGHGPVHIIAIHGWFNDSAAFDAMLAGFDPERFDIEAVNKTLARMR